NATWLDDYALFMALREAHDGAPWNRWGDAIRCREPGAVAAARAELSDEVGFHCFAQFVFAEQWHALKSHAAAQGIRIMGDLPIFVAQDSADVWAHPELFALDESG